MASNLVGRKGGSGLREWKRLFHNSYYLLVAERNTPCELHVCCFISALTLCNIGIPARIQRY